MPGAPSGRGTTPHAGATPMQRLLGIVGMLVLSWVGWWAGAQVGTMTAFFLSAVGAGVGLYLGRKLADRMS